MMKKIVFRIYFWSVLWTATIAQGVSDFATTPQEQALCDVLIYQGHDTSDRTNWGHMHHFCDCIRFTNRALKQSGRSRDFELVRAINNCDYVLNHTQPNFFMRGDVHLQKGVALRMAGKDGLAAAEFRRALSINPGLVPAYTALGDFYARIGKRKEALDVISEGLKNVPDAKALQRRYTELGGKLPYPEPLQSKKPSVDPIPDELSRSSETDRGTEETPTPELPNPGTTAPNAGSVKPTQPPDAPEPGVATPIGTPSNPWCRFCP